MKSKIKYVVEKDGAFTFKNARDATNWILESLK